MIEKKSKSTREKPPRHIEERLTEQLAANKSILKSFDDGIPLSANGRKEYMARVSLFYESVFKKRLERMNLDQLLLLSRLGLREDETLFIRSNINVLNLIDEWFQGCIAEHVGDIEETRRNETENEMAEGVVRLKEIIGE